MIRRQRGFALLVVLLAMGFLALLGTQLIAAGRTDTRLADNIRQAAVLQAAADGAIARTMFEMVVVHDAAFKPDNLPRRIMEGSIPVVVRVQNEADRINLNTSSLALMQAFLSELGVPPLQAAHVAAAILDWRTGGDQARPNGAKTPQYQAAGLPYGPPGAPFESVDELREVLGMTPQLFALMAPHVTVLTDGDPDMSTLDPVVARALADAAGGAQEVSVMPIGDTDLVLRVTATAVGTGQARYAVTDVVTGDFRGTTPRLRILWRGR
jgi:general secretion pathway protein K